MIWTVLQIHALRLLHNRTELLLTFVAPVAFFSIFAVIFGGGVGGSSTPRIKVVAVDEAASAESQRLLQSLRACESLRFLHEQPLKSIERKHSGEGTEVAEEVTRADAERMVRQGRVTLAIVVQGERGSLRAQLLADASDQVAGQVVSAIVGRALMIEQAQRRSLHVGSRVHFQTTAHVKEEAPASGNALELATAVEPGPEAASVEVVDLIGGSKANPVVSMYAAGIAVMFLLFGATSGGGALLEERENQTLDRLLSTQLTMDQLLLGKWFYLTGLGVLQVSVMFVWGEIVFGIGLWGRLDGFLMMTVVTASAAAAFGLCLATLCRSRGQLNALSVILVLTMSALGGSMVPRYVMSERVRNAGQWTFNAWALDGYDKVFWRDLPVAELWPQLGVLMMAGTAFLLVARGFAFRWEAD